MDLLTRRALSAFYRDTDEGEPDPSLCGPVSLGGLHYVVLRDRGGTLAVYRVAVKNGTEVLRRMRRWPIQVEGETK